jgi:beta-N-acetylhexosaminidase
MEDDLGQADWVVISFTDAAQGQIGLISRFLRERPDLLREKRLILFSFGAPYYFDTTTISKFTAYFALYSKQPQFVDVAARYFSDSLQSVVACFDLGIGYDLISVCLRSTRSFRSLDLEPVPPVTDLRLPEATRFAF